VPGTSCHSALKKVRKDNDLTIALAGNPNVGKSSIFNRLTGMGVVTANYPGKTVEINIATTELEGTRIGVVDLPGTYALGAVSEDQWVARRGLLDGRPDVVVLILDATNLARNLYMALQILELEIPLVIALNLVDQAEKRGLRLDAGLLAQHLGVPVIETVATRGEGLDELVRAAADVARESRASAKHRGAGEPGKGGRGRPALRFGQDVEDVVCSLTDAIVTSGIKTPYSVSPRSLAILLLEGDEEFVAAVKKAGADAVLTEASRAAAEIEAEHGETAATRIARERHGSAGTIAEEVLAGGTKELTPVERFWRLTTAPATGLPILIFVLGATFTLLFSIGGVLASAFTGLWAATASPAIQYVIHALFGTGILAKILVWGPDAGIEASLSVGIPYVFTFYLLLALLEDSGYLNSVAFLTDRVMHRIGLHGRAVIPLVAGMGCNVPAIIGTRVLSTTRERVIASTLIALIPCSARTAVIMGAVAATAGPWPAVAVFAVDGLVVIGAGIVLNRMLPGESTGLVMEMFPFRMPSAGTILKKTWFRFKDFVFVATPIVLGGSLLLGALYETGAIYWFAAPLAPIVQGILGLPPVAGLTLIFAVLRKELALQLLVTMSTVKYGAGAHNLLNIMSVRQLFVYALVNTIYIPCVATIAILARELSWRRAALVVAGTVSLAVAVGGLARLVLAVTHWLG
jgi:ferrous iron transport protein B